MNNKKNFKNRALIEIVNYLVLNMNKNCYC